MFKNLWFLGFVFFLRSVNVFAFQPFFGTWMSYAAGVDANSMVASDLHGDGDLDSALANPANGSVSVLKNLTK